MLEIIPDAIITVDEMILHF